MSTSSRKRQAFHDFFLPSSKRTVPKVLQSFMLTESTTGSNTIPALDRLEVPGLTLFEDFITVGEEQETL